jgi:hypothetical protein
MREPDLERPFHVPGGMAAAWAISCIATAWSALAALCLLWPGFGTDDPDASLPAGFEDARGEFEVLVLSPVVLLMLIATAFYALGRHAAAENPA